MPIGETVRRYGCNIRQNGNTITLSGKGYYVINASATLSPTAAGDVGISMLKNGIAVQGANANVTVGVANNTTSVFTTAIVRNNCDYDNSDISFVLNTTGANITNFAVTITKL